MIEHKKEYGLYLWDTFDGETILIHEGDSLDEVRHFAREKYGERFSAHGADQIEIVNKAGDVIESFNIR